MEIEALIRKANDIISNVNYNNTQLIQAKNTIATYHRTIKSLITDVQSFVIKEHVSPRREAIELKEAMAAYNAHDDGNYKNVIVLAAAINKVMYGLETVRAHCKDDIAEYERKIAAEKQRVIDEERRKRQDEEDEERRQRSSYSSSSYSCSSYDSDSSFSGGGGMSDGGGASGGW